MTNGAHSQAGRGRVAAQRTPAGSASCSPTRVPPPGLLNTVRPSCGVPGRRPTSTGRSSGRPRPPGGSTSRSGRPAARPARSAQSRRCARLGVERGHVHVGEVAGGRAGPGRPGQVARLRVQLDLPVGWSWRSRSPARRAEAGRGQLVLGVPVQLCAAARGRVEGLPERRGEVGEDADLGRWPGRPSSAGSRGRARRRQQRPRPRRGRSRGRLLGLADERPRSGRPRTPGPGHDADAPPSARRRRRRSR